MMGIADVLFQFLEQCSLAERCQDFLQPAATPTLTRPLFERDRLSGSSWVPAAEGRWGPAALLRCGVSVAASWVIPS